MQAMSKVFILEGHVVALQSILLFSCMCIGESESELGSKNAELHAAAAELEQILYCLRFTEDVASLMRETVQGQVSQLCKVEQPIPLPRQHEQPQCPMFSHIMRPGWLCPLKFRRYSVTENLETYSQEWLRGMMAGCRSIFSSVIVYKSVS